MGFFAIFLKIFALLVCLLFVLRSLHRKCFGSLEPLIWKKNVKQRGMHLFYDFKSTNGYCSTKEKQS